MTNQTKLRFIKIVCWIGIISDALWAAAFLLPHLYEFLIRDPAFNPDIQVRCLMGVSASLMTGWTILLLWASGNPVERRIVLLLTAYPVTTGLFIISTVKTIICGDFTDTFWIMAKTLILTVLFTIAYIFGNQLSEGNKSITN